jgi:hypothetical protein
MLSSLTWPVTFSGAQRPQKTSRRGEGRTLHSLPCSRSSAISSLIRTALLDDSFEESSSLLGRTATVRTTLQQLHAMEVGQLQRTTAAPVEVHGASLVCYSDENMKGQNVHQLLGMLRWPCALSNPSFGACRLPLWLSFGSLERIGGSPQLVEVLQTPYGNVAIVALPLTQEEVRAWPCCLIT